MTRLSRIVERGCNPTRTHPLATTIRMATVEELEHIIAFWRCAPERIFGTLPDDVRSPVYGADPIDGRKSFYLLLLNHAVQQRQRRQSAAATATHVNLATATPAGSDTARDTLDLHRLTITDETGALFQAAGATYSISQILTSANVAGTFVYDGRTWVCIARNNYAALCHQVIPIAAADHPSPSPQRMRPFTSLAGRVVHHEQQPLLITAATLEITYPSGVVPAPQPCSSSSQQRRHPSPQVSIFALLGESSG